MQFYIIMFFIALLIVPILHIIIDEVSDVERKDRSIFISSLFWIISIPYLFLVLICSVIRLLRDVFAYSLKYRNFQSNDMAKKYNEAADLFQKLMSISYSRHLEFPKNRPEQFKTSIVNGNYDWKLIRYIGRIEELVPKYIKEKMLEDEKNTVEILKAEAEKKDIEDKFKNLSA